MAPPRWISWSKSSPALRASSQRFAGPAPPTPSTAKSRFSYSWDHPWLYWGLAFALFYLAGSPRVVPVVGAGIGTHTMSRVGVLVAIVLATVAVGAIAAALLATVEPLPEALPNPLAAGLVVTAGGLWLCA